MNIKFVWSGDVVPVNYSFGLSTFVYTSAYEAARDFEADQFFVYYQEGLVYYRGDIVILDPVIPNPEKNTFVDLYYNQTLRSEMEEYIHDIARNLSTIGVGGIVLGDEWPRGLNNESITIRHLSKYNTTFHDENGIWIRCDPTLEEKRAIANWFYSRSIEAWNRLAENLRSWLPDMYLGTNIDLVWEPDYERVDAAHWKPTGWWSEIDPEPYDFVVTHYYTKIDQPAEKGGEMIINEASITRLRTALSWLTDPGENISQGLDIYLMLGSHCAYPYIITPMQMIREWNAVLEFSDRLTSVGWFTFDIWDNNYAPLKKERLAALKWFHRLNRYGPLSAWMDKNQIKILMEPKIITVAEGEEVEVNLTIFSYSWGGNVSLARHITTHPWGSSLIIDYHVHGLPSAKEGWLGFLPSGGRLEATVLIRTYYGRGLMEEFYRPHWNPNSPRFQIQFSLTPTSLNDMQVDHESFEVQSNMVSLVVIGRPRVEVLWESDYDSEYRSITPSEDGGFVIGGSVRTLTGDQIYLAKVVDESHQLLWERIYTMPGDHWLNDVSLVNGDGYIVSGTRAIHGSREYFLLRIDTKGNKLWEKSLSMEYLGYTCPVPTPEDGGFILAGYGLYACLLKMGPDGKVIWNRTLRDVGVGDVMTYSIVNAIDGGYLVGGLTKAAYPRENFWVLKIDDEGNKLWNRSYGGGRAEHLVATDGGYIVAGLAYSVEPRYGDICLFRIGVHGDIIWRKIFDGIGYQSIRTIERVMDGVIILGRINESQVIIKVSDDGETMWRISPEENIEDLCWGIDAGFALEYDWESVRLLRINNTGSMTLQGTIGSPNPNEKFLVSCCQDGTYDVISIEDESIGIYSIDGGGRLTSKELMNQYGVRYLSVYGIDNTHLDLLKEYQGETSLCRLNLENNELLWDKNVHLWDPWEDQGQTEDAVQLIGYIDGDFIVVRQNTTVRINNRGEEVWSRSLELVNDPSSGYSIPFSWEPGRTEFFVGCDDGGFALVLSGEMDDIAILRFDSEGEKIWNTTLFRRDLPLGWPIVTMIEKLRGGFILVGLSWAFKFDEEGNKVWYITIQDTYSCNVVDMGEGEWAILDGGDIMMFGSGGDYIWRKNFSDTHWQVARLTGDGGLIVVGVYLDDLRALKMDRNGDKIWERIIGESNSITSIVATQDGGLLGVGWTHAGPGGRDMLLIKMGLDNDLEWKKFFGGEDSESAESLAITKEGDILVVGTTSSHGPDRDVYLLRLKPDGERIWEKTFGTSDQDYAEDILITDTGNYVVVANSASPGSEEGNASLLCIDHNGNVIWEKILNHHGRDIAHSIAANDEGYLIVGDTIYGESELVFLIMIDSNGNEVWESEYEGLGKTSAQIVITTKDRNFLVGGHTSTKGEEPRPYLLMLNSMGVVLWEKTYPSAGWIRYTDRETTTTSSVKDIVEDEDGNFIVVGHDLLLMVNREGNREFEHHWLGENAEDIAAASDDTFLIAAGRRNWSSYMNANLIRFEVIHEKVFAQLIIVVIFLLRSLISRALNWETRFVAPVSTPGSV
jgi:hypothetical protein